MRVKTGKAVCKGHAKAPFGRVIWDELLFVSRAQRSVPAFTFSEQNAATVEAIRSRLDGLPLAVELTAARVSALPTIALLARLDHALPLLTAGPRDQPARLQTMGAAIAWSHDLLSDEEQALFRLRPRCRLVAGRQEPRLAGRRTSGTGARTTGADGR